MTLLRPPTDEEARAVVAEVYSDCKILLVDKNHNQVEQAVAWVLGKLREAGLDVPTADGFLRTYATTLPSLDPAYVAVVGWPGDPAGIGAGDLFRCVHEAEHAWGQIDVDGPLGFCIAYLGSASCRGRYEAHAVGAADELRLEMGYELESPATHAERFRCYNLDDARVAMMAGMLASIQATLRQDVSCYQIARKFTAALASRGILA